MVHDVGSFKAQYQLENNIVVNRNGSCNIILNNGINLMHHSITLAKEGHSLQAAKKEQIQATCIQEQDAEHNANYAMRFEDIRQRKPYSPRIPYIKHNGL